MRWLKTQGIWKPLKTPINPPLLWNHTPHYSSPYSSTVGGVFHFIISNVQCLHITLLGLWPFIILTNIQCYIGDQNWGVTIPSPYNLHCPQCTSPYRCTCTYIQNITLQYLIFCNLMTPTIILTNNLSFPSTFTTKGSVPPSLHHNPSGCPTSLLVLQHRPDKNSKSCGSRNSNYTKMDFLYTYVQMYIQIPLESTKCCGYSSCMASSCSHVASSGS
jgi:hypothetical protein